MYQESGGRILIHMRWAALIATALLCGYLALAWWVGTEDEPRG